MNAFKTGGIKLISEEEIEDANKELFYYASNWKRLKRGCREMIDMIAESADMNPKEFIKKVELETDEDNAVNLDSIKF